MNLPVQDAEIKSASEKIKNSVPGVLSVILGVITCSPFAGFILCGLLFSVLHFLVHGWADFYIFESLLLWIIPESISSIMVIIILILSTFGITFGVIGIFQKDRNRRTARAGIICCIISFILAVLYFLALKLLQ